MTRTSNPAETDVINKWLMQVGGERKAMIDAVRKIIKGAAPELNERIKWNAPSYYYNEDIVTFGPARAKDQVILVFHHPSIVKIRSELLQGNYKDRRLVYLNSPREIKEAKKELERIIKESVRLVSKV